jgi:Uma2 family endonuclease
MPDIPGARYEIIDGELYVSRQPKLGHQYSGDEVYRALANWNHETGAGFAYTTPGLVFAEDNDVIPDLVWVSRGRLAEAVDDRGHFRLAPELVVEVLSHGRANEVRDRELKLALYSRQGVREYWIVDWQAQKVEVYRPGPTGLQLAATLGSEDNLTSPLLPGFSCPVAGLWAPGI